MPRPPIIPFETVKGAGEWDAVRTTKGGCGVGTPPCQHFGFDAIGKGGTSVAAPDNGWVLVSQPVTGYPFAGYDPAVVLLAHDDRDRSDHVSTRYTLLGHLTADSLRYRIPWSKAMGFVEASAIDDKRRAEHGWLMLDDGSVVKTKPGLVGAGPDAIVEMPSWAPYVKEGETLGTTAPGYDHTHWEVRIQPLAGPKVTAPDGTSVFGRIDPVGWLKVVDPGGGWQLLSPSHVPPAAPPKKKDDGLGWLVVGGLVLLALDDDKRRR